MFDQFEDVVLNKIVTQLQAHGINVDVDTLKKLVANSPHFITEVEGILQTKDPEERKKKINDLIQEASGQDKTDTSNKS
jgi:hypothetical protein